MRALHCLSLGSYFSGMQNKYDACFGVSSMMDEVPPCSRSEDARTVCAGVMFMPHICRCAPIMGFQMVSERSFAVYHFRQLYCLDECSQPSALCTPLKGRSAVHCSIVPRLEHFPLVAGRLCSLRDAQAWLQYDLSASPCRPACTIPCWW